MKLEVIMTKRKGRGVFALVNFRKGDLVEVCPVIAIIKEDDELPNKLEPFPFEWTKRKCAIVGGNASFYNHAEPGKRRNQPNVEVDIDKKNKKIIFTCIAPIAKGDEVTFDYRGGDENFYLDFKVK